MERPPCVICGRPAVALHHVVAECHSPNTVGWTCAEHHKELDGSLYYARVHRRDRSIAGAADRDYALVRGARDVHMAMLRAAGSDPRLIELIGRAQYGLGRYVAAQGSPEERIGPRPPTSGAFGIKTERLQPRKAQARRASVAAPDWLDRLRALISIWSALIGDYSEDREMQRFFGELADGLGNDRLRAWIGSYRAEELDDHAEILLRDLGRYVEALLTGQLANEVIQVVAAHLKSCLFLLRDLSRSDTARSARAAVDAFIETQSKGGFNRSSQHSIERSCDGQEEAGFGSGDQTADAFAGAADGRAQGASRAVLECNRLWRLERGGGGGGRRVGGRWRPVVSGGWRDAVGQPGSVVGALPVVRRARGDRVAARPEVWGAGDRPSA